MALSNQIMLYLLARPYLQGDDLVDTVPNDPLKI